MVHALLSARLVTFAGVTLLAAITLALSAHITNNSTTFFGLYFTFAAFSIATACLSLLTLPAMIIIDNVRKGAASSYIAVEAVWLFVLGIFWLASAALASQAGQGLPTSCSIPSRVIGASILSTTCNELKAIQAFTFLSWLASWGYAGALLGFAILLQNRGYNGVWTQSVKDTDFNAPPAQAAPQQQVQGVQQVHPVVTPQLVSQQGSFAGSPAFGQPAQVQYAQPALA